MLRRADKKEKRARRLARSKKRKTEKKQRRLAAISQVFGTLELAEMIFLNLDNYFDLFAVQEVSQTWEHTIQASPRLLRKMMLLPDPKHDGIALTNIEIVEGGLYHISGLSIGTGKCSYSGPKLTEAVSLGWLGFYHGEHLFNPLIDIVNFGRIQVIEYDSLKRLGRYLKGSPLEGMGRMHLSSPPIVRLYICFRFFHIMSHSHIVRNFVLMNGTGLRLGQVFEAAYDLLDAPEEYVLHGMRWYRQFGTLDLSSPEWLSEN